MEKAKEKILLCLYDRKEVSMIKILNEQISISRPSLGRHVEELRVMGLVSKERCRGEPRQKIVKLTDKGERVASAIEELMRLLK